MEQKEQLVYETLDRLAIPYEIYRHEPLFTIEAAKDLDEKMGLKISKNLFLSSRHGQVLFLLLMEGDKKFHTGKVSKQLSVPRMTFGKDEDLLAYLNVTPGSVTPAGLLFDTEKKVQFLIDGDLLNQEKIAIHPCVNTATVVLRTQDLLEKFLPACGHDYIVITVEA